MAQARKGKGGGGEVLTVKAPNFGTAEFLIEGIAPYVQHRFANRPKDGIHDAQAAGSAARSGKAKPPKDFQACYEGATHRTTEGWCGIPANGLRAAMISACRTIGVVMTRAKLAVFIEADGVDPEDGTPLVRITKGEPHYTEMAVRNNGGVLDLRARPMWDPGWQAVVRIRFDKDMIPLQSVANLFVRVGLQVGIGEGRPDSKSSCGMGWGLFTIKSKELKA